MATYVRTEGGKTNTLELDESDRGLVNQYRAMGYRRQEGQQEATQAPQEASQPVPQASQAQPPQGVPQVTPPAGTVDA